MKHANFIKTIPALILLSCPALAGEAPVGEGGPVFMPGYGTTDVSPVGETVLPENASGLSTAAIVSDITAAHRFCGSLTLKEYVADCIAAQYRNIAQNLPDTPENELVRDSLNKAATEIEQLVRANASPTLPRGTATNRSRTKRSPRPLTPVRTDRVQQVNARTAEIMQETATILLRATENSTERRTHYQRVAQAIEGGTILLRSL